MNRRTVIKNLALIIGGAAILPSCMQEKGKASIGLKNINIDADQEKLIGDMAETIIPKTTTPGAKDLQLHLFVLKMVDDCCTKKDQQDFITGMGQFTDLVKKQNNRSFSDCDAKQREEILLAIDKDRKDPKSTTYPPELKTFYNLVKGQTVNGYTTSKYFMTKQVVYELVPGRYNAFYPVKKQAV
ncbi:gluconate 2-dehydrogenase subunit 3 family protein [Mucilaginibacter aquaedulcis]|uniref:gluconate 2-dehydrogenase subunit 3 family protein n=1 Tax=Mucilaginibacter aquaedulcis TaxID=1187081 RepID=UPI0025B3CEA1|nr:gluconate 2-dehydrogenase subunit 3 family protein [Mucilaginibacter aquaedulcis]MDN3547020.1 gluconate 2-dehydrogenase subunit 3 family protein [Mucilaginibacter aquaedulcis]